MMKTRRHSSLSVAGHCAGLAVALVLLTWFRPAGAADKVQLFAGDTLQQWRPPTGKWTLAKDVQLSRADPGKFAVIPGQGVMVNGTQGRTVDLLSRRNFGDVEAHIEFCISRKSNSGVYFMGRYEVQIYDSFGVAQDKYPGIECGGIYPRWTRERGEFEGHSPRINASKPAGQWQSFDVIFRAPRFNDQGQKIQNAQFVRVAHNGRVVHEHVELTGPTRAARFNDEQATGPLMLQGDHGPVAYRNVWLKSIDLP